MMNLETLKTELHTRNMEVTFTKKDGSERVMVCTLADDLIPEEKMPKGTGKTAKPDHIVSVFDLEKEDWRSFDFNSVTNIEYSKV